MMNISRMTVTEYRVRVVLSTLLKFISTVCGILAFALIYGAVGTGDYEAIVIEESVHSTDWFIMMGIKAVLLIIVSFVSYHLGNCLYSNKRRR